MKLLEVSWPDAKNWVESLTPGDEARKTEMRRRIAVTAYVAGAQEQLLRLFPHLAEKSKLPS